MSDRLRHALTLALLLIPFLLACWFVKIYAVDTPFNDDFTFAEDWVKYKNHALAFGDFFTAHMEHRVAVPRMIAVGLHLVFGHDLRWQNFMTLALLLGTGWNILVIWKRTCQASVPASWLPLLLISSLLFCAIQWQALLWPIMFEVFVPIFCFTLALRLWVSSVNHWVVLAISALCAVAGTLSFGNGVLSWVLLPITMLIARSGLDRRTKWLLFIVWMAMAAVTLGLYTHNLRNAAPAQFAYGQGSEETVGHDFKYFLLNFDKALSFASALLGCHLSRGLHLQNIEAAEMIGGISLSLFSLVLVYLFIHRRDKALLLSAAPWVTLGLYSIGTAMLITMARLWLTRSNALAITGRYVCHPIPLTIALIALLFMVGRRWQVKHPSVSTAGAVLGGTLLMLIGTQWVYGVRMMELWAESRLQGKALILFAKVMPNTDYLASVAGEGAYAGKVIAEMHEAGSLRTGLLSGADLNQFRVSKFTLTPKQAIFKGLRRNTEGEFEAEGYSEIPGKRPADLVIFTHRTKPGEYKMFAFGTLMALPRYIQDTTYRDNEFMATIPLNAQLTSRWDGHINVISMPPEKSDIDAWALDVEKMTVYRILDDRIQAHPKLSKLIYPNSASSKEPRAREEEEDK